jgi:tetraacyldisaccharide 4'-kinase
MSLATLVGSLLWSSGSKIARVLASTGALHSTKLNAYVISVGNLQAGGAGKTPLVAQIAREALAKQKSVCILTRGYGGECESTGAILKPVQLSPSVGTDGTDIILEPKKFGDEAVLLRDLAPGVWIAIGADRVGQYQEACRIHGRPFDVVILDDGFQHWKILKDREILAVTSRSTSDTFHRDFVSEAGRADLLVWTKGETRPQAVELSGKPSVKVRYMLELTDKDRERRYWLISAIGDAESFRKTVETAGLEVVRETKLTDHAAFSKSMIEAWLKEAHEKNCRIAVTGKDWVKWRVLLKSGNKLPEAKNCISVFEPKLVFETGREVWEKVLWS